MIRRFSSKFEKKRKRNLGETQVVDGMLTFVNTDGVSTVINELTGIKVRIFLTRENDFQLTTTFNVLVINGAGATRRRRVCKFQHKARRQVYN